MSEENAPASDSGQLTSEIWFMSTTGEEQEYRAEGRVRQIAGDPNRVEFYGSCILEDAPERTLTIEGEATISLRKTTENESSVEHEMENPMDALTGDGKEFQAEGKVRRILEEANRVQFNGVCVLKEAPDRKINVQGVATVTMFEKKTGSDTEEKIEKTVERELQTPPPPPPGIIEQVSEERLVEPMFEMDQRLVQLDRKIVERMNPAPDEKKESINRSEEDTSVSQSSVEKDISDQDDADIVSPIRHLKSNKKNQDEPEEDDDPFLFTPIRQQRKNFDIKEESDQLIDNLDDRPDDATDISPVRRSRFNSPENQADNPFFFTPIQHRKVQRDDSSVATPTLKPPPPRTKSPKSPIASPPIYDEPESSQVQIEVDDLYEPPDSPENTTQSFESSIEDESSWSVDDEEEDLKYPFESVRNCLVEGATGELKVGNDAVIFTSAVVEMLTKRLLVNARAKAENSIRSHIMPDDIAEAVNDDGEMRSLLKDVIIAKTPLTKL